MSKIILSSDQNIDYLFYVPLTSFVCQQFGFEPLIFLLGSSKYSNLIEEYSKKYSKCIIINIDGIPPYRDSTVVQMSRLYAACFEKDDNEYLMTGDIDMLLLNNYLYRDFDKMNLYGYDLTNFQQYPICYIGMQSKKWKELLNIQEGNFTESIIRDLEEEKKLATSSNFNDYWFTDQRFITRKIKQFGENNFQIINRGLVNGCATKRIDRSHPITWNIAEGDDHIDCHLLKEGYLIENFNKIKKIIQMKVKHSEWIDEYFNEFNKIRSEKAC